MIPLSLAEPGKEQVIKRVGGNAEVRQHLENLGFVVGGTVTVLSVLKGNVIVKVKESRIAIDDGLARKIMV
ncbi:MAG: ferrous iron transport protein A [Sarcina sp.]|uniref:FeoA family protein n=1 Tax=Sarcina sp. DSM 11001 TaxID=1798184 RepID=UPI000887782B|nr:FeoA family protein [Sarcina sp. DSM 11001]MBE5999820.1 ferrous iron transport protein A [Sarcina sp.]MDO5485416.1 FeoA family protein [Sarcina sp.]SDL41841.1 ferrous iron transport protein A [Sarcina sp. DSM 11001]